MKADKYTKETILNIDSIDRKFPNFKVGDTIEVTQIVKEGNKERFQMFMGNIITYKNNGIATTFTVRRIGANNIGVEKIFPYYSPIINQVKIVKKGKIRRAKLYYLRSRIGKAAKIKENVLTKSQQQKSLKTNKQEPKK